MPFNSGRLYDCRLSLFCYYFYCYRGDVDIAVSVSGILAKKRSVLLVFVKDERKKFVNNKIHYVHKGDGRYLLLI